LAGLKRNREIRCTAAQNPANREKLKRNLFVQQERPFNPDLHPLARANFELRTGGHQDATTAHIDHSALAGETRRSRKRAEANA
jgi:hypothetical protein